MHDYFFLQECSLNYNLGRKLSGNLIIFQQILMTSSNRSLSGANDK